MVIHCDQKHYNLIFYLLKMKKLNVNCIMDKKKLDHNFRGAGDVFSFYQRIFTVDMNV